MKINFTILCLTAISIIELVYAESSVFVMLWVLYGFYKAFLYHGPSFDKNETKD